MASKPTNSGSVFALSSQSIWFGLTGLALLLLLGSATRLVVHALAVIQYPYELNYGEGVVFNQISRLLAGESIYPDISHPPYIIGNYPPVFYYLTIGLSRLTGLPALGAGRLLSFIATAIIAGLIGLLIRDVTPDSPVKVRNLAAAAGSLMFLGLSYTFYWGPLMRVDMLAICFSLAGMWLFLHYGEDSRQVYGALFCFLLAAYTKHTAFAASLACLIPALIKAPKQGLRLILSFGLTGLGLFLVVNQLTDGQFFFHLVTANNNIFVWDRIWILLQDYATYFTSLLVLTCLAGFGILKLSRDNFKASDWKPSVLICYGILAFLLTFMVGKVGSSYNYGLDFMVALSLFSGIALLVAFKYVADTPSRVLNLWALVPALLISQILFGMKQNLFRDAELPDTHSQLITAKLVDFIKQTPGPIFTEEFTLALLADKTIEFDPFIMTQLTHQKKWDQTPFLNDLQEQKYSLLVLKNDLKDQRASVQRLTPEAIEVMKANYWLRLSTGKYWVYLSKSP